MERGGNGSTRGDGLGRGEPELSASTDNHHILVLEHGRGALRFGSPPHDRGSEPGRGEEADALVSDLRRAGYQVTRSGNVLDSQRLLRKIRPSIILCQPLVSSAEGVEIEMLASVQNREDPIPVLLLLEKLEKLRELRLLPLLFKDFLIAPFHREECLHRIELLLQAKKRYLSLQSHARKLEGQVIQDFKTGLYTDRHFRHLLRQEFHRAERHRQPLSFLLIDIDDFKAINDRFEYSFGDFVLGQFAKILRGSIRDIDHAARFGGDEFMVLLPNTTPAEAVQVAARIRNQTARREFDNGSFRHRLTLSIGIDTYDGRGGAAPDELVSRGNQALKEAKARGKNRIWLWSGESAFAKSSDLKEAGEARTGAEGLPPS